MDKALLRARMRAELQGIKPLQRALEEELVNAAILGTPEWQDAARVLLYKHKGSEFSVNSLGNAAFRDGKTVAFPRVDGDRLVLHRIDGWTGLMPGAFGIDEPGAHASMVDPGDVDVAVVPGLAWTKEGGRLGQGGGFYDRLLPGIAGVTMGVGFDVQLVDDVPVEDHDVPVDQVWWAGRITET